MHQPSNAGLPLRYRLTVTYVLSCILFVLMAAAATVGISYRAVMYPTDDLLRTFVPTDVTILCIGLPILVGSMWLTWRRKLMGLLLWPGALLFALYNYVTYVFVMPLNWVFVLNLAAVGVSAYALIALLASIDGKAVRQRLSGVVRERLAGGILAGLGLLFFLRASGVLVDAVIHQGSILETERALNASDFMIAPSWVFCGVLLWRRLELGYVIGLGLLLQASLLFIGLIIFMLIQPSLAAVAFSLVDILVVFAMGFVCFVPFALYARGVSSGAIR
jgi:hypothetical protein